MFVFNFICLSIVIRPKFQLSYFYPHTKNEYSSQYIWNEKELYRMKILENLKGILVAVDAANFDTVRSQVHNLILHYNHDYPVLTVESDKNKSLQQVPVLLQQNLQVSYQHVPNSHLIFALILPIQNEDDVIIPQQKILQELFNLFQFQMKDWVKKLETLNKTITSKLDEIFGAFFNIYFSKSASLRHSLFLEASHTIKLSLEANLFISEELTSFEASSNSSNEEFHNCSRPSFILGTCLFYNGSILCSHLPEQTTQTITKYVLCHQGIAQRTKQSAEETFVVSVFLSSNTNQVEEYTMVLYCQREFVLVSILKFMSLVSGQRNVYYFEEMQATLHRIISKDLNSQIEKSLAADVVTTDISTLAQSKKGGIKQVSASPRTITLGSSSLLHYFTYQTTTGMFISPLNVCHSKVEQLFVKYIKVIRHALHKQRSLEEQKVIEYGIKVIETEIIPNHILECWIIGYMNPITQPATEVYVCYEDGNVIQATQIVELASKLL